MTRCLPPSTALLRKAGFFFLLASCPLFARTFDVTDYGALGNASFDNTTAIQNAANSACTTSYTTAVPSLYFPRGQYNVSNVVTLPCALYVHGDGPQASIIFHTNHSAAQKAFATDFSLTMVDIAVNTTPLTTDLGMAAVVRGSNSAATSVGQTFQFIRFNSAGFNFGLIISGKDNYTDLFDTLVVEDCDIRTNTATGNNVSNPINIANGKKVWISNNTLTGDGNGDHAVYTLAVREIRIAENRMEHYASSAIKLTSGTFGVGAVCPTINNDYLGWTVRNNTIRSAFQAVAAYTYCGVILPVLNLEDNVITENPSAYAPDYAAVFVQANCQSIIRHVNSSGNSYSNLGIGGIVLLSSVQSPADGCADALAKGTIEDFTSANDSFKNISTSFPGVYPAINSGSGNLLRAAVTNLGGGLPINLSGFQDVQTNPTSLLSEAGTPLQNAHLVIGNGTLVAGSSTISLAGGARFTAVDTYRCTVSNSTTAIALVVTNVNGTSFTVTGTLGSSDPFNFICVGN
ncbi:MAG: glycoside hydrolase family 55 protein [Acidobacteriia bacterium]|nr:glycoside hydrolase family 55 protein [Terriglobia bacterium]